MMLSPLGTTRVLAFWVWTKETNKWVNPKYAVKETPFEQLEYALSLYQAEEYKNAIPEFKKLIRYYPRSREAADAQYYVGASWEAMGNAPEAFKTYQEVIEKYPFSERCAEIVRKQYDMTVNLFEGKDNRGNLVKFAGDDYAVVEMFKTVIKNAPYGDLAPPSRYKIGLYLMENNMYREARDEFEKVVNDYPETRWAQAAQYQIAISDTKRSADAAYDQKITQEAVNEFSDFVKKYPQAQLSDEAKDQIQKLRDREAESHFLIARFYEKNQKYTSALVYYQTIVDDFKNSKWTAAALKKIREVSTKVP